MRRAILSALCATLAVSPARAQSPGNNNAPWELWIGRIRDRLAHGESEAAQQTIQTLTFPMRADWLPSTKGWEAKFCRIVDRIPSYSPNYKVSSLSAYSEWRMFIDSLKIPEQDPTKRRAVDALSRTADRDGLSLDRVRDRIIKLYNLSHVTAASIDNESFDVWLARNQGRATQLTTARDRADESLSAYTEALVGSYRGNQFVRTEYNKARSAANVHIISDETGHPVTCPIMGLSPSIDNFGAGETWHFDSHSSSTVNSSSSISGGGSYTFSNFVTIGGHAGGSWSNTDQWTEGEFMDVTFQSIGAVSVDRSQWFDEGLIKTFWNGPWRDDSPAQRLQGKLWFVDKGPFGWIPMQFLVAKGTTIKITLSGSHYTAAKSEVCGGADVSIGPFKIAEANACRENSSIHTDDANNTITITDSNPAPLILAVVNEPLGQ